MKWLPAQDELLLQLATNRGWSFSRIAARFGCTEVEVQGRLEVLKRPPEGIAAAPTTQELPSAEQIAAYRAALDPVQLAFLDLCSNYNEMGARLKEFSELVSSNLAAEELEKVIDACSAAPRASGESFNQKFARLLHERCVIIPRPKKTT